jgi:uncharacterized protein (TIRG00374 family)
LESTAMNLQHQVPSARKRASRLIGLGAKIVISMAALAYLAGRLERDMLIQTIGGANLGLIMAAISALALQPLLATIRWRELLRAMLMHVAFGRLLQIIYVAQFFNQVLPASIGADVIRVWMVRRDGCSLSKGVISVFIDRFVMILTLLILAVLGYFALSQSFVMSKINMFVLSFLIIFPVTLLFVVAIRIDFVKFLSWRLWDFIDLPIQNLRMFLVHPKALASVSLFSLASHANIIFTVFLLLLAFDAKASFVEVASLMPLVLVAATLPISVGGWGVRELAMVAAFAQLGVPETATLSASVLFGIISIIVTLPGAAIFAALRRQSRPPRSIPADLEKLKLSQRP